MYLINENVIDREESRHILLGLNSSRGLCLEDLFLNDTSATKPSERYSYVLSVHSSKAIMVEEIETRTQKYEYALADAVIQLALKKGKREGVSRSFTTVII